MIRSIAFAALAVAAFSLPSAAATVFSTDFSGDTPTLNGVPGGFTVTGQVDIVGASNPYGITTPGGNVVDLDGTTGPGKITSALSYAFNAGDKVLLSAIIGGAQRGSVDDRARMELRFDQFVLVKDMLFISASVNQFFSGPSVNFGIAVNDILAGSDPFSTWNLGFTALEAGSLKFSISTTSADNIGPLVAGVTLDIAPIPLPAAAPMLVLGLGLLAGLRRRKLA